MIPAGVAIYVCAEPIDMRRSFDGLALCAREHLNRDPQQGGLFVFANRRSTHLKLLWFDRNGYCILYKRLHRALFALPKNEGGSEITIDGRELAKILAGVPTRAKRFR